MCNIQEYNRLHGGKISNKANALDNTKDTMNYIYIHLSEII